VSEFCQPVWEWVIADAIESGLLDAPGFDDLLKRHAYLTTQWCGTEMEAIDPLKEAKASETEIAIGVKSRRYIVESQGRDFDKQIQEYEEEKDIFADPAAQSQDMGKTNSGQDRPQSADS
jgi:capsid protein